MTTLVRIVIALLMSFFLSSCAFDFGNFGTGKEGNGEVVSETRTISEDFTRISASEGLQVYISQDDEFSIKVEADENIIDLIATDTRNGKLRIHALENIGRATKNVYVSLPKITALSGSSGAYLASKETLESTELEINGSSGANLKIDVVTNEIEIDASSGASLNIDGTANEAVIDVSSGGSINASDLQTKNCNAEASSGGNVKVKVSDNLYADAGSGGNISYSGDPTVTKKKSVSGGVNKY